MIISQTTLSSAHLLLQLILVLIQMVLVWGGIVTLVHVDGLPQLDPSIYEASVGISPMPALLATEADTEIGVGHLGIYIFYRA